MQITNEEMETLNRASEILSKYADQGDLSQEDFDGNLPFSLCIQVPRDEYISKIAVRFVRDPAFL